MQSASAIAVYLLLIAGISLVGGAAPLIRVWSREKLTLLVSFGAGVLRHPARHDEVDPLADVHGVVSETLVETGDEAQLHGLLDVEAAAVVAGEDLLDEAGVEVVEDVVCGVERVGPIGIAVEQRRDRLPEQEGGLVAHADDERSQLPVELEANHAMHRLGDVGHQVGAALDLRGELHTGDEQPEVGGDRVLQRHDLVDALLEIDREEVDLVVGLDDRLRRVDVELEQDFGDPVDGVDDERAHLRE